MVGLINPEASRTSRLSAPCRCSPVNTGGQLTMRGPSTLLAILLLGLSGSVHASIDRRTVTWNQHPGAHLPLQLHFTDEANRQVTLADYFGRTPVVLVLTYFSCPELCPMVLQGVGQALRSTGLVAGRDYALLA